MRVGLLGGTFDPPHEGHLRLALVALEALGLDEVRFVPAARPPHKGEAVLEGPVRMALLQEALAEAGPAFRVDPVELELDGLSRTARTLDVLHEREPGSAFILLMGSDQAARFETWHRPEHILARASLAVSPRPGFDPGLPPMLSGRVRSAWSGLPGEVVRIPGTELALASRELRALLARGSGAPGLPSRVATAITKDNLYR
jgi:nicotinate-nucleotide adenylyltransferase